MYFLYSIISIPLHLHKLKIRSNLFRLDVESETLLMFQEPMHNLSTSLGWKITSLIHCSSSLNQNSFEAVVHLSCSSPITSCFLLPFSSLLLILSSFLFSKTYNRFRKPPKSVVYPVFIFEQLIIGHRFCPLQLKKAYRCPSTDQNGALLHSQYI
jgi:hypothetical protein